MRLSVLPLGVGWLATTLWIAAWPAAAAQPADLRAQVETMLRTDESLKIPANVDRACVLDRALIEYPKVAKNVDFMMRLRLGGKRPPEADDGIARMKVMLAAVTAIGACTPKPAK